MRDIPGSDAHRLRKLADAQRTQAIQRSKQRAVRCREADVGLRKQDLRLCLEALAEAFQPGSQGEMAELPDDVCDHDASLT